MSEYPVYSAILARRSIRNYKAVPVEHEKIDILLKAAMAAPSRAGSSFRARAMERSAVASTPLSRFCMNSAEATISAMPR